MSGAWSSVVRFACHVPFGMIAFRGRVIYGTLRELAGTGIFDVITHGRAFLYGLSMYSTWGVFGFVWNFIMFIGCIACDSYLCVLLGLVDTMIAVSLAVSAAMQAQFMPTTYSACGGATDWRNGTDGRNFFLTANSTTFTGYGGPSALCFTIVENWAITVAITVLYGLTGIINIAFGVLVVQDDRKRRQSYRHVYGNSTHVRSRSRPGQRRPGVMGYMSWLFLWALFILAQLLPVSRFGFRYTCKVLQRARNQKHGKGNQRKEKPPPPKRCAEERGSDANELPGKPFEPPDAMLKQLHFVELVDTSQSSKALRMRVFGQEDVPGSEQLDDLRQVTCHNKDKSSCEMCGIQICPMLPRMVAMGEAASGTHMPTPRPGDPLPHFADHEALPDVRGAGAHRAHGEARGNRQA
ncbi:hypothetical protein S40288_11099 [Stachybotrys chartarum IBT 40288]|nr:hypothetical protein S40288_11099 [Stachybotrys chartarum IBT 40288]